MSLTLEMSGQEQNEPAQKQPRQNAGRVREFGSITCPPAAGQAPKEDWKGNLMCQQKDTLHLGSSVQRGATLGCGSLGDHSPPTPYSLGVSIFSSRQGSPLPWGSITQELAQDPGVGRELAEGGEGTKAQTAKGTRK